MSDYELAIIGAHLIDGLADAVQPESTVLIGRDGCIGAVGLAEAVPVPDDVPVLPAAGMTLLPGFVDSHQHVVWDKTLYSPRAVGEGHAGRPKSAERQLVRAGYHVQMALGAGVTTLRDCGADDLSVLALRDAIDAGEFVGPRILACGRMITTTAGHTYTDWGVDTAEELRKAVRQVASHGADFVKIMVSGGTTSPGTNISRAQYSLDELRTAVDDAHRLGLQVAGHAISTDSIRLAAQAGFDTIEHCSWIGGAEGGIVTDDDAVDFMLKNGVCVDHAIIPRPYLFPEEVGKEMTPEEKWWFDMLRTRWPFLHTMRRRGVRIILGTDAAYGAWPGTALWPGFQDLARAAEIAVRWAEFTPLDAIKMVTSEPAKALALDREVGTITVGKRADMVLLTGDPLTDIRALRDVDLVFRDGRLVAERGRVVLSGVRDEVAKPRGWELPEAPQIS